MGAPVVTSPEETLKTVWRRPGARAAGSGWGAVEGGGGGGTEKSARSWGSVSRRREVISWFERRAFVKILGGGKLLPLVSGVRTEGEGETYGSESMPSQE